VGTAVLLQREVMSLSPDVRGDPERAVMFGGWYPPIFTFDDRKVRDLYVLGDIYGLIEQVRLAKQPDEPLCRLWVIHDRCSRSRLPPDVRFKQPDCCAHAK
jgi:hypothetical protein